MTALLSRALRDLHASHRKGLAPIWDPNSGLTVRLKVSASTALVPERTRCKECRNGLDDLVVLRMFCSYSCAGLPEPDENPGTAPRMCKRAARTDEPGEWVFKQRFATEEAASRYLKPGMNVYRCSNCFALHLGNMSAPPKTGVPSAPTGVGNDLFGNCVLAVLHARGELEGSLAAVAAAKRDVRAVFDVIKAEQAAKRTTSSARKPAPQTDTKPAVKPAVKKAVVPKAATAKKTATKKAPARKAPAKATTPKRASTAPAKKATAKKAPAKKTAAKKAPARKAPAKKR
jgi:hypothetical protein